MATDLQRVHDVARSVDAERWNAMLQASAEGAAAGTPDPSLPGFPPDDIQLRFNGRPAVKSLSQAFDLYRLTMRAFRENGTPRPDSRFLDFGAGWGRVWRYFLREFAPEHMAAFDVNPKMADFWSQSMLGARLDVGTPFQPLPYWDGTFDLVVSNSVFSHLSLRLNMHSAGELRRIMRPGGVFVGTTFGLTHLRLWRSWQEQPDSCNERQRKLASLSPDYGKEIDSFERGGFVYLPANPTRPLDYENTAFSGEWIRANWSDWFELLDFIEDGTMQPVFVCRALQ